MIVHCKDGTGLESAWVGSMGYRFPGEFPKLMFNGRTTVHIMSFVTVGPSSMEVGSTGPTLHHTGAPQVLDHGNPEAISVECVTSQSGECCHSNKLAQPISTVSCYSEFIGS